MWDSTSNSEIKLPRQCVRERHDANVNAKEDWWKLKWIDKTRAAAKTQSQRFKGEEQPKNWFLSHRTSRRKVLAPKIKSKKSEKRWHQESLSSKIIIKSFSSVFGAGNAAAVSYSTRLFVFDLGRRKDGLVAICELSSKLESQTRKK